MPHPVAIAILAGLISSGLFLSLMTGLPGMVLFAYFVQMPLMFAGLTLGVAGSVIAVAAGLLVIGLIAGVVAAGIYAVVQAAPAMFVVRQALLSREVDGQVVWYPAGLLLAQLALIAAAALALAHLALMGAPGGFRGQTEAFVLEVLHTFGVIAEDAAPSAEFGQLLFLFPGLMAASWLIMAVVNFVGAQLLAMKLRSNRRPSPDFDALQLPWWLWPALGAAAFLSLLGNEGVGFLGRATLVVLVVPHGFLGLAVLHVLARRSTYPGLTLVLIYGCILILSWPLLMVVLLGLVEDWVALRRRMQ